MRLLTIVWSGNSQSEPMRQWCSSTTTAAPEHRYPVAIEEAYAATCYVLEHPEEFEVDATRLAVAGDSVGGNMATVVCLFSKQRSGPRIAGQLLFYPVTNADFETGSYKQFADGPWLTRGRCSGSGTNIFLITTGARIPRLRRCWHHPSNSPAHRAQSLSQA
jgi:acetyl esterase/lipase